MRLPCLSTSVSWIKMRKSQTVPLHARHGPRYNIQKALEKKICFRNAKGDIVINLDDKGWGERVLLRADGTTIYITQDIGTAIEKFVFGW